MIKRIQIGDTIFTEETTFYVAKVGKENDPYMLTPNKEIFERQKKVVQDKVDEEGRLKQIKIDFDNV